MMETGCDQGQYPTAKKLIKIANKDNDMKFFVKVQVYLGLFQRLIKPPPQRFDYLHHRGLINS